MKLKILQPSDVSEDYVAWFSNKDVIKYSDNQYRSFTIQGQITYVKSCLEDRNLCLYGIFIKEKHIGNIALSGIKSCHKRAELTYVIGDQSYWGKGIGEKAVALIIKIAKNDFKLYKLFAGIAKNNIGSKKVLERNRFTLEGHRKNHLFYNNVFEDQLDFGLIL